MFSREGEASVKGERNGGAIENLFVKTVVVLQKRVNKLELDSGVVPCCEMSMSISSEMSMYTYSHN